MKRRLLCCIAIAAVFIAIPFSVLAAPVNTPDFWGNIDNDTISLRWEFNTRKRPPIADYVVAPSWFTGVKWTWSQNLTWINKEPMGKQGGWLCSGQDGFAGVTVDNEPRKKWSTEVWWQLVYFATGEAKADVDLLTPSPLTKITFGDVTDEIIDGGWHLLTGTALIKTQPRKEQFKININAAGENSGNIYIDQLHVATHSVVPEPLSMLLVGSSLIGFVGFKKFKKED